MIIDSRRYDVFFYINDYIVCKKKNKKNEKKKKKKKSKKKKNNSPRVNIYNESAIEANGVDRKLYNVNSKIAFSFIFYRKW